MMKVLIMFTIFLHQFIASSTAHLPGKSCTSTTDLQKFFGISSFLTTGSNRDDILMMDVFNVHQRYIWEVLQQYPRLRDLHNEPPFHAILIHMSAWIARGLNATLLSAANLTLCPEASNEIRKYPTLVGPIVSNFLFTVYKNQEKENLPKLKFGLKYPMLLNFAYCYHIDKLVSSDNNFSLLGSLLGVAEMSFWLLLSVSIILVAVTANFEVVVYQNIVKLGRSKHTYFMATLSALLSNNSSGRVDKKSLLCVMWMYVCVIFVTFYSGKMTSAVISPPRKVGMTRVEQLVENNYSLIFDLLNYPVDLTRSSIEFAQTGNWSREESTSGQILNSKVMKMVNEARIVPTVEEFWEALAIGGKYAVYVIWPGAIFAANQANKFLSDRQSKKRKCAIGEELRYLINFHYGYTGYHNARLAKVSFAMDESGFYALWWKEFFGLATSRRVQSRLRVVNPTKLLEDTEKAQPLELEGKLKDIFFLWMICIAISATTFIVERCYTFLMLIRYTSRT